jgi:hypothetical protein
VVLESQGPLHTSRIRIGVSSFDTDPDVTPKTRVWILQMAAERNALLIYPHALPSGCPSDSASAIPSSTIHAMASSGRDRSFVCMAKLQKQKDSMACCQGRERSTHRRD